VPLLEFFLFLRITHVELFCTYIIKEQPLRVSNLRFFITRDIDIPAVNNSVFIECHMLCQYDAGLFLRIVDMK